MLLEFVLALLCLEFGRNFNCTNSSIFGLLARQKSLDNSDKNFEKKEVNILTDCTFEAQNLFVKIKIDNFELLTERERKIKLYLFLENIIINKDYIDMSDKLKMESNNPKMLVFSGKMSSSKLTFCLPLVAEDKKKQGQVECLIKSINKNIDDRLYFKERLLIPKGVTVAFEKFNNCQVKFLNSGEKIKLNQKITDSVIEIIATKLPIFSDNIVRKEIEVKILETEINEKAQLIISQISEIGFENDQFKLIKLRSGFSEALLKVNGKMK